MKRRSFIAGLATAVALPSLQAKAQTAVPTIGVLSSASPGSYAPMFAAFRKGLTEGGFIEGQNVKLEFAFADEHYDRLPALAAQMVQNHVSLIVAATTPAAIAA